MDRQATLFGQMDERVGPVILTNTFIVEPEEADRLKEAWASDAAFMKRQPGFISTQLHYQNRSWLSDQELFDHA